MRRTNLRRLEALENQQRCREQKEQDALQRASFCIWEIVLAYYLGELDSDKELLALKLRDRLGEAFARALKYESKDEYRDVVLVRKFGSGLIERYTDAYDRLFANVGLDLKYVSSRELFDAFVTMVDQLPDQWANWLRSNLQRWCRDAELGPESNLPRGLSPDNFLIFRKERDEEGNPP